MGQLIKLQDYISRYEQDIYRYPTQYVRLKKQQWSKLQHAFQTGVLQEMIQADTEEEPWIEEKPSLLDKLKNVVKRTEKRGEAEDKAEKKAKAGQEEEMFFSMITVPETEKDLKVTFLDQLFHFQMKWATTTIRERSLVDRAYYRDEKLKLLLQRFPDTYLILFEPVLRINKAPIQIDTIILTPTAAWCITFLEEMDLSVYEGNNDKFWVRRHHEEKEQRVLNPLISLQRSEKIINKLFNLYQVELPIKKAVISRNSFIEYTLGMKDLFILDKKRFPEWFEMMRKSNSPIKRQQIKGAEVLLNYSQTTSMMRMEWSDYDDVGSSDAES
ncbi:NERD domain-containing protein [Bacillus sp. AGMB 02131]|uniref:NERD domain-containing protein n=1 Tax=Peribacillus faecalis TaxID=2772559 RepID=A0A927HDB3_9BACI|nr:nuclease-related domain-containing protein [Peribacillus faecalis]MBD3110512.1 NERD domain-containing protein [Peribacillus faecalis]